MCCILTVVSCLECLFISFYYLYYCLYFIIIFFFKQKTAYEMRISDWSSDVCSSDLGFVSFLCEINELLNKNTKPLFNQSKVENHFGIDNFDHCKRQWKEYKNNPTSKGSLGAPVIERIKDIIKGKTSTPLSIKQS